MNAITASYGTITLKTVADIPARLVGGAGVDVTPTSGFAYRIDLDIEELPTSPVGNQAGKFTAVWDAASEQLMKVEFTNLPPPIVDWSLITGKPSTFPPTLPIAESDVTNLVSDLAARPTEAPSDGHTYGRKNGAWSDVATGVVVTVSWTDITGKPTAFPPSPHGHVESDITNLVSDLAARELIANKGVANGYASLDATGIVPAAQRPPDAASDGKLYGRLNGTWSAITGAFVSETSATGAADIPAGTTAQRPANAAGRIRFNSDLGIFEGNYGSAWAPIGGGVQVGVAPPSSPNPGDLWWKSDLGLLFIYYNDGNTSQWVVATPAQDLAGLDSRYVQQSAGGLFKIASGTPAIATSFDISIPAAAAWPGGFEILLSNIASQASSDSLALRFSNDGTTYGSASQYRYSALVYTDAGGSPPSGVVSTADTSIKISGTMANTATWKSGFRLFFPWTENGQNQNVIVQGWYFNGTNVGTIAGAGVNTTTGGVGMPLGVRVMTYGNNNFQSGARWQLNGFK